jgi:hypothetical protein
VTLAAASPLTTSVIVPGSLLRVLNLTISLWPLSSLPVGCDRLPSHYQLPAV